MANQDNMNLWNSKEMRYGYDIVNEKRNVLYKILRRR